MASSFGSSDWRIALMPSRNVASVAQRWPAGGFATVLEWPCSCASLAANAGVAQTVSATDNNTASDTPARRRDAEVRFMETLLLVGVHERCAALLIAGLTRP